MEQITEIQLFTGKPKYKNFAALNREFIQKINTGQKKHNIVPGYLNPDVVGNEITFLLPQSNLNKQKKAYPTDLVITGIDWLRITYNEGWRVEVKNFDITKNGGNVNYTNLEYDNIEILAINEGFSITQQLYDACLKLATKTNVSNDINEKSFYGSIVHWHKNYFQYV